MLTRWQRKHLTRKKLWLASTIIPLSILILWGLYLTVFTRAVPVSVMVPPFKPQSQRLLPRWRDVLSSGIPGLEVAIDQPQPVKIEPEVTTRSVLRNVLMFLTEIDIEDLRSLFRVEIPAMALFGTPSTKNIISLPDFSKLDLRGLFTTDKPLVGIYHTHTAESFIPDSGVDHKPGGQRGDIVDVGEAMVKRFAQHGVPAIQSKNIHDYPSFMKAYDKSEVTVRKMVEDNPSLKALFDIHRDAGRREEATAIVNGLPVARILIVVGRGQPGLEQPHWEQNYAFAKLIDAKLNQYYPGVSRGIELVDWRYNQHLHPHALLFEMGSQYNTKEEATRTIEMIADIVTEIFSE